MKPKFKLLDFIFALLLFAALTTDFAQAKEEKKDEAKSEKKEEIKESPYLTIKIEPSELTPKIPAHLWDEIEKTFHTKAIIDQKTEKKDPNEHQDEEAKKKLLPLENMPLFVELVEKNQGVLKEVGYNLELPPGGGKVDLKDYVNTKKGSFFYKIKFAENLTESKDVHIYYISNARKRVIDQQTYGAGCGVYLEITKYFVENMSQQGILVNTSDLRYVSVLAGTYIFTIAHKEKLYVAQLTLNDSRYSVLNCDKLNQKK